MRVLLPCIFLGCLALSCDSPTRSHPDLSTACNSAENSGLGAGLEQARALWSAAAASNYEYRYSFYCECSYEHPVPWRVRVVAGKVAGIWDGAGRPVALEAPDQLLMEERFAAIDKAITTGFAGAHVCFDADLGYPRWVFIDWNAEFVDEETSLALEITSLW